MLQCICSDMDHRRFQNLVRTSAHCVNFALEQVTIEVLWPGGRVELASVVF